MAIFTLFSLVGCAPDNSDGNGNGNGNGDGNSVEAGVVSFTLFRAPNVTEYDAGDEFNPLGLVFLAEYEDGRKRAISPRLCESSLGEDGIIEAGMTKITFTFGEFSIDIPITVSGDCAHDYSIISYGVVRKTNYVVGDTFYQPFTSYGETAVSSAECSKCHKKVDVTDVNVDQTPFVKGQTTVAFTAKAGNRAIEGTIPVTVLDAKQRLEAETFFGAENVDKTQTYATFSGVKTRSPGLELENNGSYVEWHYFAQEEGYAELVVAMSYTNVSAKSGSVAAKVEDSQVNKFLTVAVNGGAITIPDTLILKGGGKDDGIGRHSYTNTPTYLSLGKVWFDKGENTIKFTQKYFDQYINVAASNANARITLDAIELFGVKLGEGEHVHEYVMSSHLRRTKFVEGESLFTKYVASGDVLFTATCSCGDTKNISEYTLDTPTFVAGDKSLNVSALVAGRKISMDVPIEVFPASKYTKIEMESLLETAPASGSTAHWRDGGKNYNTNAQGQINGSKWSTVELSEQSNTAVNQTTQMTINLYSETQKTVYIVLAMATTTSYTNNEVTDVQINKMVSFTVNGQAISVGDSEIIAGIKSSANIASTFRNNATYFFTLAKVTLNAGYNTIVCKGLSNNYMNGAGTTIGTPAMVRFDYIELFETAQ